MQFEVPAGNALVFSRPDGSLLPVPQTQPLTRPVTVLPPR
jgi:hypothetical protein